MADLTELQSTDSIKIIGSDPTGLEQFPVASSATGDLFGRDVINTGSVNGAISVSTTAVQAIVGGAALSNRKMVSIIPTNGTIYWGSSNAVTTVNGTPLTKNQSLTLSFTAQVPVWLIAASATDVRIVEGS